MSNPKEVRRETIKKELFVRPHPNEWMPDGELQVGWRFTGERVTELPFGAVGLGTGKDDQERRLQKYIADLRVQQKELGNDDFTVDDMRPAGTNL